MSLTVLKGGLLTSIQDLGRPRHQRCMGVRLEGPVLDLEKPREMISSAVNAGIVQVQSGGQPIILLCSRQTVGGYPRLGAVAAVEDSRLAVHGLDHGTEGLPAPD